MRVMIFVGLVLVSACASTSDHPGWTGHNAPPFENTVARCQIETQTVDGPDFERCMASLGWTREQS